MKSTYIFIVFLVVAGVQLFVPTQMILNQESILKTGTLYKLKTQPVDPSDPFKGKYINLNYDIDSFKTNDSLWQRNELIYVYIEEDSLGYAKGDTVSRTVLPENENDYINAKVSWYSGYNNTLNIAFDFNRYYMEETKAYDAEVAVRNAQRDSINDTHALVYVKAGEAVLNDVIIDDISIKDYVEKEE